MEIERKLSFFEHL